MAVAKVQHNYEAAADEELSLNEGDTIYVLAKAHKQLHRHHSLSNPPI